MKKCLLADIHENKDKEQIKPEKRVALFWIDTDQAKKLSKFSQHECDMRYKGAIGGAIEYIFAPTTLGVVVKAKCACGKEIDVTDYEGW